MTHPFPNTASHLTPDHQGGFTLLELLLVIGLLAVLFLGITKITNSWMNAEIASGAGQHMQRVTKSVEEFVGGNWSTLTETADALSGTGTWANLRTKLNDEGLLNNNQLVSPLGAPLRIAFSRVGGLSRVVIYTTTTLPYERVAEAARQSGNSGGTISRFPNATNAYGGYGQWRLPVTQLLPASAGAFPCTPTNNAQSCFVSVISFSNTTLCGLYLYRNTTSCTDGTTMAADLNMNNRNITNANTVTTRTMEVTENANLANMNVAGTTRLNGQTMMTNGLNVTGGTMNINGEANFSQDITANNTLRAQNLSVSTIEAERIETTNMDVDAMRVNGRLAVDDSVAVNGDVTVAGGGIYAAEINAGRINAGTGQINVGAVDVQNTMNITGNLSVVGGTVLTDQMVVTKCSRVQGQQFGNC